MSGRVAVILAAGKGTRMKSRIPKVLHRVCGREMLGLVVDSVASGGYERTVVVVPPESSAIRQALGGADGISFAVQEEQLGTGHALLQARGALEDASEISLLCGDLPLLPAETLDRMRSLHRETNAVITLLTATPLNPDGLGRIVRDSAGNVTSVVEDVGADEATLAISEVNGGVYCFRPSWLWPNLEMLAPSRSGEFYLTNLVSQAYQQGATVASLRAEDPVDIGTINTRVQLAEVEAVLRQRIRERWMLSGVTMPDPASVYIDLDVDIGPDTTIQPNSHVVGDSRLGRDCQIGPNAIIDGARLGNGCKVVASVVKDSTLEDGVSVGPFSHIRPGSRLGPDVHVGTFGEVKNSELGRGSMVPHFSYVGDAEVGERVNVGAGTVTCNYDGVRKHRTRLEDDAFVGSASMLVAPVTVGARSTTGAGSVVTRDVPADSVAVGVPARIRSRKATNTGSDEKLPAAQSGDRTSRIGDR